MMIEAQIEALQLQSGAKSNVTNVLIKRDNLNTAIDIHELPWWLRHQGRHRVKNLCAMWETCGRATHSSILAGRIPWTEQPGGLQSMGSQRIRHN